ncbi:hypothetical protein Tco_0318302 [Tanacetum coccineum]
MLSGRATRKAMLENNHCVTSACSTTLACVQEKVDIANGWVIKLDTDISRVIVQSGISETFETTKEENIEDEILGGVYEVLGDRPEIGLVSTKGSGLGYDHWFGPSQADFGGSGWRERGGRFESQEDRKPR